MGSGEVQSSTIISLQRVLFLMEHRLYSIISLGFPIVIFIIYHQMHVDKPPPRAHSGAKAAPEPQPLPTLQQSRKPGAKGTTQHRAQSL